MYFDAQNLFTGTPPSPAQAITATAASTNIIDLGAYVGTVTGAHADPGPGRPLYIAASVVQAFNNLTSLTITLQSSNDSTFASGVIGHWTVTIALAALTAGSKINLPAIAGVTGILEFLRLDFTVTGTAPTTGSIEAGIVETLDANTPTGQAAGLGQLP